MNGNLAGGLETEQSATHPRGADGAAAVVSARAAAASLGVNERTIRRAIARGELAAAKQGRAFAISAAELARYGARRTAGASDDAPGPAPGHPGNVTPLALVRLPAGDERRPPASLPIPLTRLIGREREVTALADLLGSDRARLVTLTGPGGVGKTRLALHMAATVRANGSGEVAFVPLAEIAEPSLVLPAIARTLGVREWPGRPAALALQAGLGDRWLLLVLDNFEHLAGAAAERGLSELLQRCPGLMLLVTSRTPLQVRGEQRVHLAPLALPETGEAPDTGHLATYGAIALFVERAREVQQAFALDAENAPAVVEICRRLDGLPLAIELAAAWIRLLSPVALLGRLERRLPLLTGGAHDQPARLRTMHDAIAWSYGLLSTDERSLFRRLAVFAGGFTLDAAEGVSAAPEGVSPRSGGATSFRGRRCAQGVKEDEKHELLRSPSPPKAAQPPAPPESAERLAPPESAERLAPPERSGAPSTLHLVAALIDKSLLQPVNRDGSESRFIMLETVREFALERLAASGEEAETRAAHAAHYLALAEAAASAAEREGSRDWMRRLTVERPNLRAALDWFAQMGDSAAALQMTGALWHYWYRLGEMTEGRSRLEQALAAAATEAVPAFRARALRGAGVLAWQSADYGASRERLEASLDDYRALGDQTGVAWALNSLGCLAATLADLTRAGECFNQALAIFAGIDDAVGIAQLTANLGELAQSGNDHELAVARLETAIARWEALDDRVGAARAQVVLAHALLARNESARAEAVLREALITIRDNEYEQILPAALRAAAQLAMRHSQSTAAARWYGVEERIRERLGVTLTAARRAAHDTATAAVRDTVGTAAYAAAWAAGRGLSPEQAIAEVLAGGGAGRDDSAAEGAAGLSLRQREVLRLLAAGHTDKEIAASLFITRRTASKHVSAILAKLGVPTRSAAVAVAARQGLA